MAELPSEENVPLKAAVLGCLQDHPRAINLLAAIVSVVASVCVALWWWAPFAALAEEGSSLALGLLSLAGILTGFVGVVIVFGLQASAPVFVRFRVQAGSSLGRDWLALVSTGLLAAACSMASAVAYAAGQWTPGGGFLLLGIMYCIHCALRMLWLLRVLIDAVHADDKMQMSPDVKRPSARQYFPQR